eukprot:TRINITY_DN5983_c0_g2_i1.p2 TRINITY_DN5983_c0_g2~~TRINITY_DN5983_c0_g2_i1.p2  ORF type:complete len:189 (+),score=61.76 TRINITY_DN5983_c0_g2_i1:68-634(+)
MPPKKPGKPKKKPDDPTKLSGRPLAEMTHATLRALQQRLVMEQEIADKERAAENELRGRMFEHEEDQKRERDRLTSIVADMTRQYKSMQEELNREITVLKAKTVEQDDEMRIKERRFTEISNKKKMELDEKETQVNELKRALDDLTSKFAAMLKETLEKLEKKIETAKWETDANDAAAIKRLKDLAGI